MSSKDEKFDPILLGLAQQMEGGIPQLMDSLFGFLRRKTDFYVGGEPGAAQKMVLSAFEKHQNIALEEKKRQQAEEAKRKKQEEERKKKEAESQKSRVVEIDDEEEARILSEKKKQSAPPEKPKETPTPKATQPPKPQEPSKEGKQSAEEEEGKGLAPNSGNGSSTDTYTWTQTLSEVEMRIPIPPGTKSKELAVDLKSLKLKVGLKGKPAIVEGEWHKKIKADDSYWTLEDGNQVVLHLLKVNQMEWWSCALVGEPEINTRKIQPENSRLEDLDGETRSTVEKMMRDQQLKQQGLPTTDEQKKQELLQKFMKEHPEMDFSNAKFG